MARPMHDSDGCAPPPSAAGEDDRGPRDLARVPEPADGFDLDERERRILAHLTPEGDGRTGFEGLRRRLDLHPQSLSRVLDRLADRSLVASDDEGYHRTDEGAGALSGDAPSLPGCPQVPVAAGTLPPSVDASRIREALSGRWFDGLRWYGWRERDEAETLLWLTDGDHALVALQLTGDRYLLGGEARDPTSEAHPSVSAAPIVTALGEVVGGAGGAS